MIKRLVCAVVTMCAASVSWAQGGGAGGGPGGEAVPARVISEAEVRAWLESMLERDRAAERLRSLRIRWDSLWHPRLSDAEFQAKVAESFDDPGLIEFVKRERELRELFGGKTRAQINFWWQDGSNWRLNADLPDRASEAARKKGYLPFFDSCRTSQHAWSVNDREISINNEPTSRAARRMTEFSKARYELELMFDWGLSAYLPNATVRDVQARGDRWSAHVVGTTAAIRYEGRWDPTLSAFVPQKSVYERHPDPASEGMITTWSDWIAIPNVPGEFAAASVRATRADGRPAINLSGLTLLPLDRAEFARVIQIPDPLGSDPIRGQLRASRVYDHRTNSVSVRAADGKMTAAGEMDPTLPPVVPPTRWQGVTSAAESWARKWVGPWVGWLLLAILVPALLIVRYRSTRSV